MNDLPRKPGPGRGSHFNPPNRFAPQHYDAEDEGPDPDETATKTQYFPDHSRTIITENDSPDIPFRYTLNPYRGCTHGCAYC